MKTIIYLNKKTNEIRKEIIVATKTSTAKQWAKQFILHNQDWTLKEII